MAWECFPVTCGAKWPIIAVFKRKQATLSNWFLATVVALHSYVLLSMPQENLCQWQIIVSRRLENFWKMDFFSSSSSVTVFTGFAATRDQKSWKISSASLNDSVKSFAFVPSSNSKYDALLKRELGLNMVFWTFLKSW